MHIQIITRIKIRKASWVIMIESIFFRLYGLIEQMKIYLFLYIFTKAITGNLSFDFIIKDKN